MDPRDRLFQQAMAECGAGISRVAGSYVRNLAEREDLVQDIWLAVWRALPSFRGDASLKAFDTLGFLDQLRIRKLDPKGVRLDPGCPRSDQNPLNPAGAGGNHPARAGFR